MAPALLSSPGVRIAMLMLVVLLPVQAYAKPAIEGWVGLELGPSGATSGTLGERVQLAFGGGVRFGMRVDRVGLEFRLGGRGADLASMDAPLYGAAMTETRAGVSYYALLAGPLQILGHAELGFGGVGGTRSMQVACPVEDECPGGSRTEDVSVTYGGFGVHVGATVQVHVGRRGRQHALLWATAGMSAMRYRFETDIASGRSLDYAFGAALAF